MQTPYSLDTRPRSLASCTRSRACCLNSVVLFFHVRSTRPPHSMQVVRFRNVSLLGVTPIRETPCHPEIILQVRCASERLGCKW
jgi:hypothetical protein